MVETVTQTLKRKTILVDDRELIRRAKEHPAQFKHLYTRYYKQIFHFILSRTNNVTDSADICSEVFFKAMTKLSDYQDRGFPYSTWLTRIAINLCHDHFKNNKKTRYVLIEGQLENELFEELEEPINTAAQNRDFLTTALKQLSIPDLELIELRYFEKKSFRDIGYLLEISENNAKVKTYRILDKLKKIFSQQIQ